MIYISLLLYLIWLTFYYDILGRTKKKEFSYWLVLLLLVLMSGLRYRVGADSLNYLNSFYYNTPTLHNLTLEEVFNSQTTRYEPFFYLLNILVKSLGLKFYFFQLVHAFLVNTLIFVYIRKHCDYVFSCVLFYFFWIFSTYNFEELRASLGLVFCLYANDFFIKRKWIKGICFCLMGCMFHFSVAVFLLTPFFLFLKTGRKGYLFLIASYFVAYIVQNKLGDFLFIMNSSLTDDFSGKMSDYVENDVLFSQWVSLKGIALRRMPCIVFSLWSMGFIKSIGLYKTERIKSLEPIMMLGLAFMIFSIPIAGCYRFVNLYTLYYIIPISQFFVLLIRNNLSMGTLAYIRALFLISPLLLMVFKNYYFCQMDVSGSQKMYHFHKMYPYSSVIEKSIDPDREKFFRNWDIGNNVPLSKY